MNQHLAWQKCNHWDTCDYSKVLDENGGQHDLTGYVEFDNPRKGKGGKGESAAASAGTRDYARIDLASNRQVGALLKENVARLDDIVKENPAAFEDFLSYEVALLKISGGYCSGHVHEGAERGGHEPDVSQYPQAVRHAHQGGCPSFHEEV